MNIDGIWRFIDLLQRNRILILELFFLLNNTYFFWVLSTPQSNMAKESPQVMGFPIAPLRSGIQRIPRLHKHGRPWKDKRRALREDPKPQAMIFWVACEWHVNTALIFKFINDSKMSTCKDHQWKLRISLGGEPTQSVCGLALPQSIVGIPMNQPTMAHTRHPRSATEFGPTPHPIRMEHIGY